jgi:hypothetical protein
MLYLYVYGFAGTMVLLCFVRPASLTVAVSVHASLRYPSSSPINSCDALLAIMKGDDDATAKRVLLNFLNSRGYSLELGQVGGRLPKCELVAVSDRRRVLSSTDGAWTFLLTYDFVVTSVVGEEAVLVRGVFECESWSCQPEWKAVSFAFA